MSIVPPLPENARRAKYWHAEDDKVVCTLCPRFCRIGEGQTGFCFIRRNHDGVLYNLGYGRPSGFAVDPIEKKPLNHFLPGSQILSFGTVGCNLGCRFCQNWDISKARAESYRTVQVTPEEIVDLARRQGAQSIAFTYNDPVIFSEFVEDVSAAAKEQGIHAVAVTAGFITDEARPEFYRNIDAANVDIKAFTEDFYRKLTLSHLEPVLETLKWLKNESRVWVELTNLIIPGHNDSEKETRELCEWVAEHLGVETPIHFTAFHPDFKMQDIARTPPATLTRAREIALETGLHFPYTGNVHDRRGGTTYCPHCAEPLIERDWFRISRYAIRDGRCPGCKTKIAGVWPADPIRQTNTRHRPLGVR